MSRAAPLHSKPFLCLRCFFVMRRKDHSEQAASRVCAPALKRPHTQSESTKGSASAAGIRTAGTAPAAPAPAAPAHLGCLQVDAKPHPADHIQRLALQQLVNVHRLLPGNTHGQEERGEGGIRGSLYFRATGRPRQQLVDVHRLHLGHMKRPAGGSGFHTFHNGAGCRRQHRCQCFVPMWQLSSSREAGREDRHTSHAVTNTNPLSCLSQGGIRSHPT